MTMHCFATDDAGAIRHLIETREAGRVVSRVWGDETYRTTREALDAVGRMNGCGPLAARESGR